ncbi:MAG: starch synthase [Candidatus Omnitrophota bacterium]|jgi:starch synthase
MNILFASSEVYPFSKTGGLADVAGSLPNALGELGHRVLIVTPRYRGIKLKAKKLSPNVEVVFVKNEHYFDRGGIYGGPKGDYADNLKRFTFFCHEVLDIAKKKNFVPDIVHSNDWHTGLINTLLKTEYKEDSFFKNTRSLFTIHNLAYQGIFEMDEFSQVVSADKSVLEHMEFYGRASLMRAGLEFADAISTVSPTYAKEIRTKEHGCGLENILQRRKKDLYGILNGIDHIVWNPKTDKALKNNGNIHLAKYRADNRSALRAKAKLKPDGDPPIFGIVTRLAEQKGLDLICETFEDLMSRGIQFVLLGTGDARYESFFKKITKKYKGQIGVWLKFSEISSSLIYGGCDYFLMPSRFEPCGLGQMISFRYGAIPLVRSTGGLADTVIDMQADTTSNNGFVFKKYESKAFLGAVDRAIQTYGHKSKLSLVRKNGKKCDFSWNHSAKEYERIYRKILNNKVRCTPLV